MTVDDDSARVWVALLINFFGGQSVAEVGALLLACFVGGTATLADAAFDFEGLVLLEGASFTPSTSSLRLLLAIRPLLLNQFSTETTSEAIGVSFPVGFNMERSTCEATGVMPRVPAGIIGGELRQDRAEEIRGVFERERDGESGGEFGREQTGEIGGVFGSERAGEIGGVFGRERAAAGVPEREDSGEGEAGIRGWDCLPGGCDCNTGVSVGPVLAFE